MALISGIMTGRKTNKVAVVHQQTTNGFKLDLPNDRTYYLGIDQSSSCTGLSISDDTADLHLQFDVINNMMSKEAYYQELFSLLYRQFSDIKVGLLVHEHMPPQSYYGGTALLELEGRVKDWKFRIPGMQDAKLASILPQSWKPFVVNPNLPGEVVRGQKKRRGDIKRLVAYDIVQKFPLLSPYYNTTPAKDFDSFDATGILFGYLSYAYDERGNELICGIEEKTHVSMVAYRYLSPADLEKPDAVINVFEGHAAHLGLEFLVFNERYNLQKNIRMSSSHHRAVATVVPEKYAAMIQLEFNFKMEKGGMLLAYIFRKGELKTGELKLIERVLPMNKLVYSQR